MTKLNCILLIDDDSITNFINERLIKKLNVTNDVKITMNGEEGIHYVQNLCEKNELCPELILLDINMPVMNGFEFIQAFEKLNIKNKDKVKIIILTTSKNIKDVE